jgi:hypothetical protein
MMDHIRAKYLADAFDDIGRLNRERDEARAALAAAQQRAEVAEYTLKVWQDSNLAMRRQLDQLKAVLFENVDQPVDVARLAEWVDNLCLTESQRDAALARAKATERREQVLRAALELYADKRLWTGRDENDSGHDWWDGSPGPGWALAQQALAEAGEGS